MIFGRNIKEIKCDGDESCAGSELDLSCVPSASCNLECKGDDACDSADIIIDNVAGIICGTDNSCNDAQIRVTNPQQDFGIECSC